MALTKKEELEAIERLKECEVELQDYSENDITREMCLVAVTQDGEALKYVPEKFKDLELCYEAVKSYNSKAVNRLDNYLLQNMPRDILGEAKTTEEIIKACEKGIQTLEYDLNRSNDLGFCYEAVKTYHTLKVGRLSDCFLQNIPCDILCDAKTYEEFFEVCEKEIAQISKVEDIISKNETVLTAFLSDVPETGYAILSYCLSDETLKRRYSFASEIEISDDEYVLASNSRGSVASREEICEKLSSVLNEIKVESNIEVSQTNQKTISHRR